MKILGIQIDYPFVLGALIQKSGKSIEVRALKKFLLSEPEHVKQLYNKDFKGWVATGISSKNLLIRSMDLKIGSRRHVEEAIAFQTDATSPFNPAEMIVVPSLKRKSGHSMEALLFTVAKESLKSHLLELEKLQIDPDGVSAIGSALCSFIRWKIPNLADAFIVDLGSSECSCILMEKGEIKKSYCMPEGIESLLLALWEDRKKILLFKEIEGAAKQIDLMLLKPHLNPQLTVKLNEFRRELAKAIYSFHRNCELKPVIFTGRVDAFGHLPEFLAESFADAVSPEFASPLTQDEQKFAASAGLAIEKAHSRSLQFRIGEFFPKKNWRRLGFSAIALFFFSILLACGLTAYGIGKSESRKMQMGKTLEIWLDRWDPALKKNALSQANNLEDIVDKWIAEIEKNSKDYPYMLQTPKMAEVLAWVSSHPLLKQLEKEGDPIQIGEIHYQLVQFPKSEAPKEPYLGKVEIEFQFKEATNARRFHEALLKGDERVDSHLDISWDALNNGYRTSFFLKNRSPHVF